MLKNIYTFHAFPLIGGCNGVLLTGWMTQLQYTTLWCIQYTLLESLRGMSLNEKW